MKVIIFSLILFVSFSIFIACRKEEKPEIHSHEQETMHSHEEPGTETAMDADMVIDPVCGMKINKADAYGTVEHDGKTYYFCMEADKLAFERNPNKYIAVE